MSTSTLPAPDDSMMFSTSSSLPPQAATTNITAASVTTKLNRRLTSIPPLLCAESTEQGRQQAIDEATISNGTGLLRLPPLENRGRRVVSPAAPIHLVRTCLTYVDLEYYDLGTFIKIS